MTDIVFDDGKNYPKIFTAGAAGTERALCGPVSVQEKVDGSFFAFGTDGHGNIMARSRNRALDLDAPDALFQEAIDHVRDVATGLAREPFPIWLYCEYLKKPKHNTLAYERTPKNRLVLFDVRYNGSFVNHHALAVWADWAHIDRIPVLYEGEIDREGIESMMAMESYLGGTTIEGVVVKNHNETIRVGPNVFPVFTKWVRKEFKERNNTEWKANSGKNKAEEFVASFCSEARWRKAVQHLREAGTLEDSPRDIGALVREVTRDVLEEEAQTIRDFYFTLHIDEIQRAARRGLPEWYKERLKENLL